MSTQHPDNVTIPFFAENSILSGDDEVKEAFFSYSNLSIDEQLWDVEGKEVDNHVVFKLLSKYPNYFKDHVLGKDIFLTIRCPNPEIEKTEAKILAELLSSITRNHDIASLFYKKDTTPIFEMVVPMCQSEEPLIMLREFYKKFIRDTKEILACGKSTQEWLGEFKPKDITVTPLFETKDEILNADKIVEKYIKSQKAKSVVCQKRSCIELWKRFGDFVSENCSAKNSQTREKIKNTSLYNYWYGIKSF
jgi:phosphoenolpyruvate carboxylase